jgi:hypothetical protein
MILHYEAFKYELRKLQKVDWAKPKAIWTKISILSLFDPNHFEVLQSNTTITPVIMLWYQLS